MWYETRSNGGSRLIGRSSRVEQGALLICKRRPPEFVKKPTYLDDSEEDESTAGKMPPAEEPDSGE